MQIHVLNEASLSDPIPAALFMKDCDDFDRYKVID